MAMIDAAIDPIGTHVLIDVSGAQGLDNPPEIERILRASADAAGAITLDARFHHFGEAMGVTGFLLLAESHMSIHTWPEYQFAAIDIFMCGAADIGKAIASITNAYDGCQITVKEIARGRLKGTG